MGFKTIDLDSPGGYERYNKMKETNSVKKAFEDEEPITKESIEQKNEEALSQVDMDQKFQEAIEAMKTVPKEDNIVRTGVVKGVSQLRVRTKPEGDIKYLISEDSIVKILEDHDGWWFVETAPGRQGYVMKQYIQVHTEGG
jgi:flagellar basal body rod protein FlgF